jgi:hypothetical protein
MHRRKTRNKERNRERWGILIVPENEGLRIRDHYFVRHFGRKRERERERTKI